MDNQIIGRGFGKRVIKLRILTRRIRRKAGKFIRKNGPMLTRVLICTVAIMLFQSKSVWAQGFDTDDTLLIGKQAIMQKLMDEIQRLSKKKKTQEDLALLGKNALVQLAEFQAKQKAASPTNNINLNFIGGNSQQNKMALIYFKYGLVFARASFSNLLLSPGYFSNKIIKTKINKAILVLSGLLCGLDWVDL